MSLTTDTAAASAIAAPARGAHWLIDLDFASGMLRLTTWPLTVTIAGQEYIGLGQLLEVGGVSESEDASADKLTISLSVVNSAMLAQTLGNIEGYRGRRARLALQMFGADFQPAGSPIPRWTGYMNPVEVPRTPSPKEGGPSTGRINLPCTRAGIARARNYEGRRLTHAQQQADYPGDRALEGLQLLIEQPTLWLSKRFQEA